MISSIIHHKRTPLVAVACFFTLFLVDVLWPTPSGGFAGPMSLWSIPVLIVPVIVGSIIKLLLIRTTMRKVWTSVGKYELTRMVAVIGIIELILWWFLVQAPLTRLGGIYPGKVIRLAMHLLPIAPGTVLNWSIVPCVAAFLPLNYCLALKVLQEKSVIHRLVFAISLFVAALAGSLPTTV